MKIAAIVAMVLAAVAFQGCCAKRACPAPCAPMQMAPPPMPPMNQLEK